MRKLQDFILLKNLFTYSKLKDFFKTLKFGNIKKGDYSYYQKIISGALIFFILFNLGLRVPFLQFFTPKANAENKDFYNLVSIIVENDIYSSVESKLKRYAKDIEGVLDNTKVVLIPTPQDASAFQIASLIESLYYEGYKSVQSNIDFESKLVGTLLVGDIPLPVVQDGENFSKTILPYTDFDNKTYVYDNKDKVYKKSENLNEKISPEIWHGVISPNTGNNDDDISAIKDYFDKNHDFYTGKGLFGKKESLLNTTIDDETDKGLINGNPEEEVLASYVPYIFYFDQFREIEAINAINYNGYKAKEENKEDLVYNRFSKKLAQSVKDQVLGKEEEELTANINDVFSGTVLPNGDVIGVKKADDPEPGEQANGNRYHFKFSHPGSYYGENITVYYGCNEYEFQVPNGSERVDMADGRLWKPKADVGGNLVILGPIDIELETATVRRDGGEQTVTFTDSKAGLSDYQSDDAIKKSPDILSRYPTTETLKSFVEIFNFSALGELRKNIYNAGRYSEPKDTVNAHFIPQLIAVLDLISEQVIKNTNDKIEDKIDSVVNEGGSSKIIMFERFTQGVKTNTTTDDSTGYKSNGINEKIYPLLKPVPFISSIYADSSLSVSYYNGAPEAAISFDQTVNDDERGTIYVSIGGDKHRIEHLRTGVKWQLIRGTAYIVSDWSIYPGSNASGWNYLTCGDGKTYASPKAGTTLYYSVRGDDSGEWTNEAALEFTQDVFLNCGDKGEGTSSSDSDSDEMTYTSVSSCGYDCVRYENFFYGTRAADIENAKFCSIYRGSSKGTGENKGTLVEANRGYNINILKPDYDKIGEACGEKCGEDTVCSTMGLWGGNSPVNMDENITSSTETGASVYSWKKDPVSKNNNLYRLKEHDIKASVTPLFDIVGSIKTSETCGAGGDNRGVYHFDKKGDQYCGGTGKMCNVEIKCGGEVVDKKSFANPGAPPGNEPSNPGSPYRYPTDYAASKKFLWKSARDNAPYNLSILISGDFSDTCEVCVNVDEQGSSQECHDTAGRMDGEDSFVFSPLDCYEGVGIMTENATKKYNISEGVGCGVNVLDAGTVDYNDIFELLETLEKKYPKKSTDPTVSESTSSESTSSGSECKYSRVFIDGNLVASYGANGNNTAQVGGAAGTSSSATQPNGDRTHFRFSKPGSEYGSNITVSFNDSQYDFTVSDGSQRTEFSDGKLWKPESDNDGKLVILGPFHEHLTSCTISSTEGTFVGELSTGTEEGGCIYEYKTIPSYIKHDSPSSTTLSKQVDGIVTDAVPIDKDRYVDFIGRNLSYKKINYYPYLFRFQLEDGKENTIENVSTQFEDLLDKTSEDINNVIVKNNGMPKKFVDRAETLTPELYDLFKEIYTTYMISGTPKEIDLYKELEDLKVSTGSLDGGEKEISYLNTLEFALYWKNINNISEKYAFVLDNYLSDQLTNTKKYGLPKNKKMYELSYMGAPGDATSMYVKMDPEGKTTGSPYTEEESENASLDNMLSGINLGSSYDDAGNSNDTGEFECGPPEGVPIWEWIPAIICWLGTVLPPTIKIGQTECSTNSIFSTEETVLGGTTGGSTTGTGGSSSNGWLDLNSDEIKACNGDFDKNGINDCIEQSLAGGSLDLLTDSTKYAYNSNGIINIGLKDKNGDILLSDNSTTVNVELSKLDLLNPDGSKTNIYTSGVGTDEEIEKKRKEANKYINFNDSYIKVSKGEGQYAFSAKNKDVDAYIKAFIELKDYKSTKKVYLEKIIKVEIRGNNFVATNYKIDREDDSSINLTSGVDTILASDDTNIYLSDGKNTNIENIKENIDSSSKSKEKLIFSLENYTESGTKVDIKYPINVKIYKNNEEIVSKYLNLSNVKEYFRLVTLQTSGEYVLEVEDKEGFRFSKNFQIKADKAYSGEVILGSNILEVGGVISTNYLIIYDEYGNVANSDLYKVSGEIDGNGIEFINDTEDKDKIDFQMLEGFKVFRTKTTDKKDDNTLTFKVSDSSGEDVLEVKNNIETVKNVHLFLQPLQNKIKISSESSTGTYGYNFSIRDEDGKIMTNFNSRLYLSLSSIYGKSKESFVSVKSGTGEVYFTTKTLADPKVKLSFQIEGLKNIYTNYVDILPEKPIKMDLILNRNKIEAKESDYSILKVELKDRYGNLVFNDNSTNIGLEIKEEYKDIISVNTGLTSTGITFISSGSTYKGLTFISSGSTFISSGSTIVSSGSILFKINATKIPGEAYIKVKAIPGFKSSFSISGQTPVEKTTIETMTGFTDKGILTATGKIFFVEYDRYNYVSRFYKLEDLEKSLDFLKLPIDTQKVLKSFWNKNNEIKVNAQDENIAKIETFYFWNKDKIDGNYYNSLYTVLLGAEYGDITQKDYLAGGILFDRDNRGLTVTSLLNNPYNYNDIVLINSNGKIKTVEDSQNLTQDIGYIANLDSNKKLYFDIYNYALSEHLGKIYYNLDNENDLKVCEGTGITFTDCTDNLDKTTILLKSIKEGYSGSIDGNQLQLKDGFGDIIFKVNEDGEISYNHNISIENYVSEDELDDYNEAIFSIKEGGEVVGIFSYNLINGKLNTTKDEKILEQKMNLLKNTIIVYFNSNKYGSRYFESDENSSLVIYYNDPFANENDLNIFSQAPGFTYESFKENYKAGWSESNKALLLYSAGETVGESTKKYASFSLINLGDPVVKLKNVKEKFPSDMIDDKPKCDEIEWIDAEQQGIDFCSRDVKSDLKVSLNSAFINLDQEITTILKDDSTEVEVPVVGNPWVIFKENGKWKASTWERMGLGQKNKFKDVVVFNGDKSRAEKNMPKDGETYGFLVSGLIRLGSHNQEIKSEIAWLKWGEGEDSESEKETGTGTIYRSFDSTVGKQISKDDKNIGYKTFDYNNDNLQDILLLKNDSYVEIIENRGKFDFSTKGNLVYMPEMGAGGIIEAGDFTGDGYDDIFFVSKGKPYLLNNVEKNLYKIPLEEQFNMSGSIIKTSAFDMDNDKILDIVTLDSSGKIHIFYGGGTSTNPEFTKLEVGDGYALYLNEDKDDGDGAVYYEGLVDIDTSSVLNNIKEENKELVKDFTLDTTKKSVNFQFIDNIIYDKIPYNLNDESSTDIFDDSKLQDDIFGDMYSGLSAGINNLEEYSNSNINGGSTNVQSKSFIRNKYASSFGLDIKKEYEDLDAGTLNPLDKVKVIVTIKNTSGNTKKKFAYAEKIPSMFNFSDEEGNIKIGKGTATRTSTGANIKYNIGDYNFLIDGLSLAPSAEITLEYEVTLIPISYGDIKTGYFEKGEDGDDEYGDIIVKTDKKSCNANPDIFKSISKRSYEKGTASSSCNSDTLELPPEFQKNGLDENKNGVPDYIDDLVESAGSEDKTEAITYATGALDQVNEDNDSDGVPDTEDYTPSYDTENDEEEEDFLTSINEGVDDVSEGIDDVANGLCNGFGGGGCISTPVNWAPLAPGNDPSVMGYPVGDGQKTGEGLPIFSAVLQNGCGYVKVWPPCPNGAGGRFDGKDDGKGENSFRLFVTPTITGAIGLAICFGQNNMSKTESPPSLFPIIGTQGRCIIVAFPFAGCDGTGADGDVQEKNYAESFASSGGGAGKEEIRGDYGVSNGSCVDTKEQAKTKDFSFDKTFMSNYLEYKETGSEVAMSGLVDTFADIGRGTNNVLETQPLVELGDGTEHGDTVDVSFIAEINVSALANGEFKDVIKLKNTLINGFPQFLMEWVNRQIEEIVTKLTSFPSLIVILPDFSGITDYKWGNFFDGIKSNFNTGKSEWNSTEQDLSTEIQNTQSQISSMNCSEKTVSDDGYFECMTLQLQVQKQVLEKDFNPSQTTSGIKAVYDFIGSLPMVNLKSQTVNVNVPWITKTSLLKAKVNFEITKKQWEEEIARVNDKRGSLDSAQKSAGDSIIVDAKALIRSLDKNIAVIEEYKKFPENLVKLLNKKEDRLNQIMCSVDSIYKLFGGRLGSNGKRFKAWVELYILIKAILKSWQIILDLFDDYDKSCKECKNERFDLRTFIWRLVSMIIPKIPVVQFPKWPNIVIDLHNIKVGLDITLPDFNFNTRPIVIPSLPKLYLPDIPNVKIKLPTLPILPSIKIPELPDLPTLPTVELPNLPPPPNLPKILSVIEVVINILKIVTKIQCILQKSPFAPERTAGTKIAYLTDRQGFFPLDFLDMSLPQFSYPFVDSIDVTTYVNFEVDADFILEFVKQGVKPLNNFTNDVVNLFNNKLPDLDFSDVLPDSVNVDLGMVEKQNFTNLDGKQVTNKTELSELNNLSKFLVYGFYNIYSYIQNNKDETVSNKEFIYLVNKGLANKNLGNEENIGKLRSLWQDVANMTYSKEDKFINDLKEKNKAKFDTLKSIINTEKQVTKDQIKSIKDFKEKSNIKFIDSITNSNVTGYNELMRKHNLETVKSTINLLTDDNKEQKELQKDGSKLLARVSDGLNNSIEKSLALNTQTTTIEPQTITTESQTVGATCNSGTGSSIYKYNYKGLYVVEKKEKLLEEMTPQEIIDEENLLEEEKPKAENYRLFDYVEELGGSEEIRHVDFDNDGDEDILYMVKNELYIKENTKKEVKTKNEISDALVLGIDDNKFFNGDIYYEALNNIKESVSFDSFINFSFDAPTDDSINNFRLEFFSIIDKYLNENHDEYTPKSIKKNIIDSFADIDNITKIKEKSQTGYTVSKNLAYINAVGNTINDDVKLTTKEVINIKDSLFSGSLASLSVDTKLYAGRTPFILGYYKGDSEDKNEITIGSYQNVKFNEKIRIFSVKGNAYVEGKDEMTLSGQTIKNHLYLPIFSGTKILLENDNTLFNESSHIDIRYYDGTENNIDFRDTIQYELYDLGQKTTTYMVYTKEDNDYYYSRALPFKEGVLGTRSNQVLLSPQVSSDITKPEINLDEAIKVPIYQEYTYDFTPYLDDTSGFSDFYIDMDLETDSDNDGDATNDRDLEKPKIRVTTKTVKAKFGPYEELINKNVGITLKDLAGNTTYKEVQFEVYAPDLEIDSHTGTTISGKLAEELLNEPVNLYRYRGGIISKMLNNAGVQKIYTNSSGAYIFDIISENDKGLDITKNGVKVASIDENTGKITVNNLVGSNIKILSSNDTSNDKSYVKMILGDNTGDIYYQYFNFNGLGDLSEVNNFKDINTEGIYVKVDSEDYYYYQLPLTVPYNPGVISIYSTSDKNKIALFSIFPDGKIYTKDNNYKLEYGTYLDNIVFKLYDSKKDKYVGEVLMKTVDSNYIVK